MLIEPPGTNSRNPSSALINDPHLFDLEHYYARMARYLDPEIEQNRVFFEALQYAFALHAGQSRRSGAPYISHPCAVAEILAREFQVKDPLLLVAALLHDVVEDVPSVNLNDIENHFGELVAELVDGCTKLTRSHLDRSTLKDLTHSKIFLSASRSLGVIIIKLADRLHNLRTLHYLPKSKRQRIAQETVEVYAPIAARLNIFPLKRELYHLALSYLYPRKSKKILQFIREFRNSQEVLEIENKLGALFSACPHPVTIRPRYKGLGSYYHPLKRSLDLANGENHIDFVIILLSQDLLDCYYALGLINSTYPPIPRSIRDYIATPKSNGYRSLHVRIHVGGHNYLIKIRNSEMDRWAMYGMLCDWDARRPLSDEHWQEISELLRNIGEYGGAGPQRKALIRLSETEEIFVYSPQGDIYFLPKGSIVLDFAYRIHSELGDHCEGALVNGHWALPTHPLKDGDAVKILTAPEVLDVDPGIEQLCKTPKARAAINKHLQQKRRHYAQRIGREILLQELERHGVSQETMDAEHTGLLLELLNLKDVGELFARLGQDLISPHLVLYYMDSPRERDRHQTSPSVHPSSCERNVLLVSELDKAVHKFARCCNPYPGQDNVVATISERGIAFHHLECKDLRDRHGLQPQQLLDVVWNPKAPWRHPLVFHLQILQTTLVSILPSLSEIASSANILSLEGTTDRHDQSMVLLTLRISRFKEARTLFEALPAGRVVIEDYGREESPQNLPPVPPEDDL